MTERQEDWLIQPSKGARSYSPVPLFLTLVGRYVSEGISITLINTCGKVKQVYTRLNFLLIPSVNNFLVALNLLLTMAQTSR